MFTTFLTQDLDFADLRHFRGKEAASQWESRELSQTSRHQGSKRAPVESVRAFDGDPWRECVWAEHTVETMWDLVSVGIVASFGGKGAG